MSYSIFQANKSTWIPDSNLNAAGSEKQFPNFCNKGKLFPFLQAPLPQCFWGRLLFNQYEKSIIRGNSCKINKRLRKSTGLFRSDKAQAMNKRFICWKLQTGQCRLCGGNKLFALFCQSANFIDGVQCAWLVMQFQGGLEMAVKPIEIGLFVCQKSARKNSDLNTSSLSLESLHS